MDVPPDHACRTGASTHGYDLWVWDCVDGQHVVVGQYSSEMSCADAVKETSACGETTPLEQENAPDGYEGCEAPPYTWETE